MPVNPDFFDLFSALNDNDVRYLVVGAYAVIYHAEPRYTKDLDVWVDPTPENAERVYRALARFGAPMSDVTEHDFADSRMIYQIGVEPNRVDILMGVEGLAFESCWPRAVRSTYGGCPIRILSLDDIIAAKRASDRPQDRLDLQRLERKKNDSG